MSRAPRLGKTQRLILRSLKSRGGQWYAGCGWYWDNASGTVRLCESLIKHGLVERDPTVAECLQPAYRLTALAEKEALR